MFELTQDNTQLETLIDIGNYEEAISFIIKSQNQIIDENISDWFINNFNKTKYPGNWLNFWIKIFTNQSLSLYRTSFISVTYLIPSLEKARSLLFSIRILCSLSLLTPDEQNVLLEYNFDFLLPAVSKLKGNELFNLYTEIIKLCLCKYNAPLLHKFYEINKQLFEQVRKNLHLNEDENEKLDLLLSLDEEDRSELYEVMSQFVDGPGNIITYGGLLTLGQVKNRKKIDLHTTLIESHELSKYINLLKKAKHPLKERFIVAGSHWITGQIEIGEDGEAKILILDSLGVNESDNKIYASTEEIIEKFAAQFSNVKIYLSYETRQFSPAGCSVFALDDAKHLIHIERFLDPKYKETGLFSYLADAKKCHITTEKKNIDVLCCHLPLTFYTTMQSKTSLKKVISARLVEILSLPINKRKQILIESVIQSFRPDSDGKQRNMRVEHLLEKFAKYNFKFFQEAKMNSDEFTFEGCKMRLLSKQN